MSRLRSIKTDVLFVAGFLLLPLVLYGNVTLGGRTMLPADNLFQWQPWASTAAQLGVKLPQNALVSDLILENYAWKRFIVDSLHRRELPLWNPYLFAGTPFLASGQHSAYYPFSLLFIVLPLSAAYGWYTVSQLWLAGALTYLFGRVLGLRRASAALAGLVYQGCGFMLVSAAVFPMIVGAAAWLPLLLASVEMVIRQASSSSGAGKTLPWAVLGAIGLGCQSLAGHIEITYYTLLVMGAFAVWRLSAVAGAARKKASGEGQRAWRVTIWKPAAWLVSLVLVGLMLGSVQLIPFIEVGRANFREGAASLTQIRGWAFPARRAVTLLLPDFFGNPADHTYLDVFSGRTMPFTTNYYGQPNPRGAGSSDWGIKNYVEGGIYLGILPLILAALGVWSAWRRQRESRAEIGFFALLSLFSLSFIFGLPTYAILYYGLPGINQLHSPFRWVFPLSLSVAVLAGYGMDHMARAREKQLVASAGQSCRSWAATGKERAATVNLLPTTRYQLLVTVPGLLLVLGLFLSRISYSSLEPAVQRLFLGLAQAADAFPNALAFYSYQFWQLLHLGLMLLAAGIVLRLGVSRVTVRGRPTWEIAAVLVAGVDLLVTGYGFNAAVDPALLEYEPALITWLKEQPGLWRVTTFAPHDDKPFNANTPWLYGIQDVRGYDSVILKQYADYMAAIEPQNELQFNRIQPIADWRSLNSPLLDLLGVKYVISAEAIDLPKLRLVWEGEGLRVYENLAVVPRAYTIASSATAVVPDPLVAMRSLDPRQWLIVADSLPGPDSAGPQAPGPAEVTAYGNVEVKVRASVEELSWLVLNDTYFQGWNAYVRPVESGAMVENQERQVDIYRANGNFRAVLLKPGQWEVRFRYSPLSFKLGGLSSFMGGIVVVFAVAVWAWRRYYHPQGELTAARSVAKNTLAPMALNLFNRAIDFAYAAFYLRLLGPADAGRFATAIIIAGWFEIISNFGLNTLVIREVSKDRSQAGRYLLNTSIVRVGTGLAGTLPVIVYLLGIRLAGNPLDANTTLAIFLIMAGTVFSGMGQGLTGLYYAFEAAEFPAAVTTVTTIMKVAFGVLALLLGYGFVGMAAVSILVSVITLAILVTAAFRQFDLRGPWQVDFGLQRRMIGQSYPLMLNHFFAVIFFQIDVPLLRQYSGEAVVGWYNSAYKWVNAINVIPSFFTFALFPVISRQVQSNLADARRSFHLAVKLMVVLALPLAAVTTAIAPTLIGILGGREFLPHGAVALQLVIWSIPIGWINSVTNYVLIALGVERRLTGAFIGGVAFNVAANLLLVPRFSYLAAAVITILSEAVLLALFAYYLRTAMPGVRWPGLVIRPLAAAGAMLWLMWLGNLVHPAAGLVLALAVYLLGLWLLRVVGDEERQVMAALLPDVGRLRRPGWLKP